jgi:hypothetical protein
VSYLDHMRPQPELGTTPYVNVLLVGPGKSGKTTGALSAPGPKLVLNFDQVNSTYFARAYRDPDKQIHEVVMPAYEEGKLHTENLLNEVAVTYSRALESGRAPEIPTVIADEESGGFERLPFTGTSNPDLGQRLVEMADIVGYAGRLETENEVKFVAQLFNGNGRRGGDRFGVLGDYAELDLKHWFDTIAGAEPNNVEEQKAA